MNTPAPWQACCACGAASPTFMRKDADKPDVAKGWRQIDEHRWLCPRHDTEPVLHWLHHERLIDLVHRLVWALNYERAQSEHANDDADKLLDEVTALLTLPNGDVVM